MPNKNSRLCNYHFVGNIKSENPSNINYNPSIFPFNSEKISMIKHLQDKKFLKRRKQKEILKKVDNNFEHCNDSGIFDCSMSEHGNDESLDISKEESADQGANITKSSEIISHMLKINNNSHNNLISIEELNYSNIENATEVIKSVDKFNDTGMVVTTPNKIDAGVQFDCEEISKNQKETVFMSCNRVTYIEKESDSIYCCAEVQTNINIPTKKTYTDQNTDTDDFVSFNGYDSIANEDDVLKDLCGVSKKVFELLLKLSPNNERKKKIKIENRLMIFLMKMKLNLTYSSLAVIFGVHRKTIQVIFLTFLENLRVRCQKFIKWPSREMVDALMPKSFKPKYEKCRVIIDCTEFEVQTPPGLENKIFFYSYYKKGYRLKVLVCCTPSGHISHVSKCYGGRTTDSQITVESGIINLLEPGDIVLADKGFPEIKTAINSTGKNVVIVMPPILDKPEFTAEEVQATKDIASVRIHIERVIGRIRTYRIVDLITHELIPYCDDIVFMCCVLVNLQPPIIKDIDKIV